MPDDRRESTIRRMPMIDVYSAAGTFSDKHRLAQDLARDKQPDIAAAARAVLSAGE
jgi:hypothetical protein